MNFLRKFIKQQANSGETSVTFKKTDSWLGCRLLWMICLLARTWYQMWKQDFLCSYSASASKIFLGALLHKCWKQSNKTFVKIRDTGAAAVIIDLIKLLWQTTTVKDWRIWKYKKNNMKNYNFAWIYKKDASIWQVKSQMQQFMLNAFSNVSKWF